MANLSEAGDLSGKVSSENGLSGSVSSQKALTGSVSSYNNKVEEYTGEYEVTPKAYEEQVLETKDKMLRENVTVLEIPIHEVANSSGGSTIYIAKLGGT